jgi:hypothetical protein
MKRVTEVERPRLVVRILYSIGRRTFGQVPTPERIMAHRLPLMVGLGALYGAIQWAGRIDARLRTLLQVHVATLYGSIY